jgi:hypothetical protein
VIIPDRCDLCGERVGADAAHAWTPFALLPTGRLLVLACNDGHLEAAQLLYAGAADTGEAEQVERLRQAIARTRSYSAAELAQAADMPTHEVEQLVELWFRHLARMLALGRIRSRPSDGR